ncbi:hypothetical protein AB0758_30815 [Tolypothrix bouteillei VB521301_2]|uniref:hypothetical protein n=1 Tax=Tolypothrix bouteillei TaxID=1246981 RepID=UPI0038B64245
MSVYLMAAELGDRAQNEQLSRVVAKRPVRLLIKIGPGVLNCCIRLVPAKARDSYP